MQAPRACTAATFRRLMAAALLAALFMPAGPSWAGPFTGGNILVSTQNHLLECDTAGTQVQSLTVPYPGSRGSTEITRDLAVDLAGNVQIYNGTSDPYITTYDPSSDAWAHHTYSGLSMGLGSGAGGIACYGNYVFAADQQTYAEPADQERGVVRFDRTTFAAQRLSNSQGLVDVAAGLDGLVYGLEPDESTVWVYDPVSLVVQRSVYLAADCRGIAVNATGEIFGASWDGHLYRFNSAGTILASKATGTSYLSDIDLASDGRIAVGSWFGRVLLTDASFASINSFLVGSDMTEVAFVPEPAAAVLLVAGCLGIVAFRRRRPFHSL